MQLEASYMNQLGKRIWPQLMQQVAINVHTTLGHWSVLHASRAPLPALVVTCTTRHACANL
eukprot:3259612-Amphidinium_carterae.1